MTVAVRPAEPADRAFIIDSWVRSWLAAERVTTGARRWAEAVEGYLAAADLVLVATPIGEELAVGWLARLDADVVGYCYVRHLFRKHGVCSALFAAAHIEPRAPWSAPYLSPKMRRMCDPRREHPWQGATLDGARARRYLEAAGRPRSTAGQRPAADQGPARP